MLGHSKELDMVTLKPNKAEFCANANHCAQYTAAEVVNKKIEEFLLEQTSILIKRF
jgi:hypothetical protein